MSEARFEELEARVARAEREARAARRGQRRLSFLLAAAGLLAVVLAARPARTQSAGTTVKSPFKVVDERGEPVFEVGVSGIPYVRLYSPARKPAVEIYANQWGGGLNARNHAGRVIGVLDSREKGPNLAIYDHQGRLLLRKP
jgi:hypothetical protein